MAETFTKQQTQSRTMRATGRLRLARPNFFTTKPSRLQQEWQDVTSGDIEWRDVPTVVLEDANRKDWGR